MTVKRRTGRLVQGWPLQGGRARVMRTSGKSLGPGGGGGARVEGERSSERQEGARARRVTARTLVLTATRGPGQRHNWTLLCD